MNGLFCEPFPNHLDQPPRHWRVIFTMLQAPAPSPYDLNLRLIGFDVRISFTFWIGSILFGFGLVRGAQASMPGQLPSIAILLALWAICMLISIAIHELGHALAFRVFGIQSHIVLYHLGGLAIPHGDRGSYAIALPPAKSLAVSAAGPLAQLASAAVVIGGLWMSGKVVDGLAMFPFGLSGVINGEVATLLSSPLARVMVVFYILPSVFWAVLNCVPVYPLDGGRILRSLVELVGGPADVWLWIGVICGGALAWYGFQNGQMFLAIMFAVLAVGNYQTASEMRGGR